MSEPVIHIIEPTLVSEAGHCSIIVQSLCAMGKELHFCAWVGRGARLAWAQNSNVKVRTYFSRRFRRLQAAWLYWRLLRTDARIVIPTAGRTDLALLDLVGSKPIPSGKVFLYVHQLRLNPRKVAALRRLAIRQPNIMLFCTTREIEKSLQDCGFRETAVGLPLPFQFVQGGVAEPLHQFRHVLVAGAARTDKGFRLVVDLIQYLAAEGVSLPVAIQTSGDHYGRYDESTLAALTLLKTLHYGRLTMLPDTLAHQDYVGLFHGAICLQPYDRVEYANKLSGISLDALSAGAPIVTLSGTWMARMVEQFEAGVVVEEPTAEALLRAIEIVRASYECFSRNAVQACSILRQQNFCSLIVDMLRAGDNAVAKSTTFSQAHERI